MPLNSNQYQTLIAKFDEDYQPFDLGFLQLVTKKIQSRTPPYLEFRELWQIDAWKNGTRNYGRLEKGESIIKRTTKAALSVANTDVKKSITSLYGLSGVGVPVASAILYFAFPDEFVVIDRFAWSGYKAIALGKKPSSSAFWSKDFTGDAKEYEQFLQFCRNEANRLGAGYIPRDIEKALFMYGENEGVI